MNSLSFEAIELLKGYAIRWSKALKSIFVSLSGKTNYAN
jgi:hypothetical protein